MTMPDHSSQTLALTVFFGGFHQQVSAAENTVGATDPRTAVVAVRLAQDLSRPEGLWLTVFRPFFSRHSSRQSVAEFDGEGVESGLRSHRVSEKRPGSQIKELTAQSGGVHAGHHPIVSQVLAQQQSALQAVDRRRSELQAVAKAVDSAQETQFRQFVANLRSTSNFNSFPVAVAVGHRAGSTLRALRASNEIVGITTNNRGQGARTCFTRRSEEGREVGRA